MYRYHITENGISIDGSNKVIIPECYVVAASYLNAIQKLNHFLSTKDCITDIELITPVERIDFPELKTNKV